MVHINLNLQDASGGVKGGNKNKPIGEYNTKLEHEDTSQGYVLCEESKETLGTTTTTTPTTYS